MNILKVTPLRGEYEKHSGKVVDFCGYELPTQFKGILHEHETVRERAGLFDVSHMGEILVKGKDAETFVNYLLTNDVKTLKNGEVIYSFMCYPDGGVVDDLLAYKFSEDFYYLVVNASNKDKDLQWILDNKCNFEVTIEDISENVAQIALQGPKAQEVLQLLTEINLSEIKFFTFKNDLEICGKKVLISRTGYTGEDGFEIYSTNQDAAFLWQEILRVGEPYGAEPIGLGARDTLRFEATLPLYGNEMDATITPLEMGFGYFVKLGKEDFIGREALLKQKEDGLSRKLVGFELVDKGIARHGYTVLGDGKEIGHVTTGYMSPTLNKSIGFAFVSQEYAALGTEIFIQVRNKQLKAVVVNKKFYSKKTQN
ncbi:glycine cleavage system aminomethyltransferase GcvT [Clostridium sp. CS001]|uniref:glycine cleavage system aminomethyltransferase GcvT n=1 Tax=Clostridium sp. CS001 TaxID=2880648 RepID=UPI001CF3199D|nr:glycine cleavage system aminomethyltransferase GcvT [Clostridium sp. CS001]MCB2290114.1 glycine cleavage system aminomethyltransferase GcvT [Clostridium sp. CS001]